MLLARSAAGPRHRLSPAGVVWLSALLAGAIQAQRAADVPVSLTENLAPLGEAYLLRAPPVHAVAVPAVDASAAASRAPGADVPPHRFAEPFAVNAGAESDGRWETVDGGRTAVWRIRIASEGAVSLNLGFSRYRMPPGGRLFLYTPDGGEVIGPFTEADNKSHGELWTPLVRGGALVVEASVPAERAGDLELELSSVNRGFRDLADLASASHASCHVDVACPDADGYRDQVRSVGLMTLGGTSGCSGVLLNNTAEDGTPYFLTAMHCGFEEGPKTDARSVVVYWNYERPTCGGTDDPARDQFQSGASFRVGSTGTDFALLELDDRPAAAHNVYYAGWDRSGAGVATAVGVHHPGSHVKSISTANDVEAVLFGSPPTPDADGDYWRVRGWARGLIEGGSSGSPLLSADGLVIGQLAITEPLHCVDPNGNTYYGRLAKSWTAGEPLSRLGEWLDPAGTGATAIDGRNWNHAPETVGALDDQALKFVQGLTPASLDVDVAHGFRDPDGDALTFAASSSDGAVASVSVSGSALTLTPASAGTATVTVTATDAGGLNETASQEMEVTVGANTSPEAVGGIEGLAWRVGDGDQSVEIGSRFRDADGDALTYGASSSDPSVASVSLSGTAVTVTPVAAGAATVTVTATDAGGSGTSARQRFEAAVNRGPVRIRPIAALLLGENGAAGTVDALAAFRDADGDDLTYSASSSDGTVATASVTGAVVTVTPLAYGTAEVAVTATDATGSNQSAEGTLRVAVGNRPPVALGSISVGPVRVRTVSARYLRIRHYFQDPDGDRLLYGAASSDSGVLRVRSSVVDDDLLLLHGISPGTVLVTVTARDFYGSKGMAQQRFTVRVIGPPVVGVAPLSLLVEEESSASYDVVLKAPPEGSVTVTPFAPADTDLSLSPASLVFTTADWDQAQPVTVEAMEDADAVSDPAVEIRHAASSSFGSSSGSRLTVSIAENDAPALWVGAAEAAESAGEIEFEVSASVVGTSDVLVDYSTSNGTARAGSDYTAASGTLTFPQGSSSSLTIAVPVLDDVVDESEEETFTLALSNARNGVLVSGWHEAAGTIYDDDDPRVTVSFGSSRYTATEGGSVLVHVRLDKDPERTVRVPLVETPRGGVSPEDYSGVPLDVTFGPGRRSREFRFLAIADDEDEDGEAVELNFGSSLPDGVTAGAGTVVAIRDDDDGDNGGNNNGGGGGAPPPPPDDEDDDGGGGGGFTPPRAAIGTDAECADGLCRALTGVPVRFEDASTGSVQRRWWDFGEGTSRSASVEWMWSSPGFYEVTLRVAGGDRESTASLPFLVESGQPAGSCVADAETLCLRDSRFSVEVEWWTASGDRGAGEVVRRGSNDSGLFSFFEGGNWEMLVKVLDGCSLNGHVWVFGASATDLGYRIVVTDTASGEAREYVNEAGREAEVIADVAAFAGSCGGR